MLNKSHAQLLIGKLAALALNAVGTFLLPLALGTEGYVRYGVLQTVALTVYGFVNLGPTPLLARIVGADGVAQGLTAAWEICITRAVLSLPVAMVLVMFVGTEVPGNIWEILALACAWTLALSVDIGECMLIAADQSAAVVKTMLAGAVAMIVARLLLWAGHASWAAFALVVIVEGMVRGLIYLRLCARAAGQVPWRFLRNSLVRVLRTVFNTLVRYRHEASSSLLNNASLRFDQIIAAAVLDPVALASYLFAVRLVEFANFVPLSLLSVSFSTLNRQFGQLGDNGFVSRPGVALRAGAGRALRLAMLCAAVCIPLLAVCSVGFDLFVRRMPDLGSLVAIFGLGLVFTTAGTFFWYWDAICGSRSSGFSRTLQGLLLGLVVIAVAWRADSLNAWTLAWANVAGKGAIVLIGLVLCKAAGTLPSMRWSVGPRGKQTVSQRRSSGTVARAAPVGAAMTGSPREDLP